MPHTTSTKSYPKSFSELINITRQEKWCVRLGCTTCGAMLFRKALREIPRDEVIAGLRLMTCETVAEDSGMFRLIVSEISILGIGVDLLQSLDGTPAGNQLSVIIEYQDRRDEKRRAYAATQTPEAIAERRAKKKSDALLATAPHRERKLASQDAIRATANTLNALPASGILDILSVNQFDVSMPAIGGLVYKRLAKHYKSSTIQPNDLKILSDFAISYQGHWKKLLDQVSGSKL